MCKKGKQDNEMLFIICFNSKCRPLTRGKRAVLCEILQGWPGRRRFRVGPGKPCLWPTPHWVTRSPQGVGGCWGSCPKPREAGAAGGLAGVKGPPILGALLPSPDHCLLVNALSSTANCIYGFLEFSK